VPVLKLLFIGFGNVAKEMARIFTHRELYPKLKLSPTVVGIFTARHGGVENGDGLDLSAVLDNLRSKGTLTADGGGLSPLSALEAAQTLDYDVLVELSALSIKDRGEPAASHIRAALERGKSVVSANKGPVAFHYRELKELAAEHGAKYLFESAVMDGAPLFNLSQRCMKGARVTGFSGILNGTTNFILAHMEQGGTLEEGIRLAQEEGIAEADPSMDVDGWDPAAKAAALANVLMDADITPLDVERSGIRGVTPEAAQSALKRGARLKLICRGSLKNGEVKASVKVEEVPLTSVFALVPHFGAAIRIESDLMNPNIIFQESPLLIDTSFGCIEDLETIAEKDL
jgi:homoserine dehydrogenase